MNLDIVVEPCEYFPCSLEVFTVNGVNADFEDFGYMGDYEDCYKSCCNKVFMVDESLCPTTTKKYGITESQFYEIASILEDKLISGECNLCN